MKVFVHKSSEWSENGEVREFESMKECVDTLLDSDVFVRFAPEIIISRINSITPDKGKDCDYDIELYDTWRE